MSRFLAEFELYVMLAAARLGEEAYGLAIRREIEARTGRPVSVGALYATLARLGEKGLMEFEESEPLPQPQLRRELQDEVTVFGVEGWPACGTPAEALRFHGLDGASLADRIAARLGVRAA